jgi:hypothetical protein
MQGIDFKQTEILDLSLLMVTCETHLYIAKLTIEEFIKQTTDLNIKKYLTSNSFKGSEIFDGLDINLIDSNVIFSASGNHFSKTVLNALHHIDSEFILFFLDDMCLMNKIKNENLKKIINLMKNESVDYYSVSTWDFDWKPFDIEYDKYGLEKNSVLVYDDTFLYMYSVQPCIWKRTSLIKILENNLNINSKFLDMTKIKNLKGESRLTLIGNKWETKEDFWDYGFKNICSSKNKLTGNYAFNEHNGEDDYFLMLYSEILRFGKFNFNTHKNNKIFLEKFLHEKNIDKNHEIYYKYF